MASASRFAQLVRGVPLVEVLDGSEGRLVPGSDAQNGQVVRRSLMRPAIYVRSMAAVVAIWHLLAIRIHNEVILSQSESTTK